MGYPRAQATYPRTQRAASMSAYLVLLRVEVTAFHPQDPVARELRLVSVALFLAFGEACAPPYNVRALPVTLLYGARTFLYAALRAATVRPASRRILRLWRAHPRCPQRFHAI